MPKIDLTQAEGMRFTNEDAEALAAVAESADALGAALDGSVTFDAPAANLLLLLRRLNDALNRAGGRCYVDLPPADVYLVLKEGGAVRRCYHPTVHEFPA